jgi:serine/threonine-protein kinase
MASDPGTTSLLDEVVNRYQDAWRAGARDDLVAYLPSDSALRQPALAELALAELEWRLRAGEAARAEEYLQRYPELAADTAIAASLVVAEYRLRRHREPDLDPAEYARRFPDQAAFMSTLQAPPGVADSAGASLPAALAETDRYRPLGRHARGGLGEVLVAEDRQLGRRVALKRMRPEFRTDLEACRRFVREAEVTGRLEHPGVVPVYSLTTDVHGVACYAMRFVEGETLQEAIRRLHETGRPAGLAFHELLSRFVTVCQAIAYAHSKGVLHRDLKPANILLGPFGETLVVDWGLAKRVGEEELTAAGAESAEEKSDGPLSAPSAPSAVSSSQTLPGQVVGTPAYMAPEQAAGETVTTATDVYGLGAVLYELLTGKPPFSGADVNTVLRRVVQEPPVSPHQAVPGTSRGLEAICLKALAKPPAERYPSAQAVAEDVERWLADEPVHAYPEPWTVKARRWVGRHRTAVSGAAAALLAVVVCLGAATGLLTAANQREREARTEATRERDEAERQRERADRNLARARRAVEDYCTNVALDPRLRQQDLEGLRKHLLETAIPFYEEFVRQKEDDPGLRADQSRTLLRLALLRRELGDPRQGRTEARQAAEGFAGLVGQQPEESAYRTGLAESHYTLGLLLGDQDRGKEAEAEYRAAILLWEQLAVEDSSATERRAELARCRSALAKLLSDRGRQEEARGEYRRAIDLQERLAAAHPDTPAYRANLAASHNNLGLMLKDHDQRREARTEFQRAAELQEQLAGDYPRVAEYRAGLAQTRNNLGNLLREEGQREEARAEHEKAAALRERLAAEHPSMPQYRASLAGSYTNQGVLLYELGRRAEAGVAYQKAIALQERLAAEHPDVAPYRDQLATSCTNLGNTLRELGQTTEAAGAYRKAMVLYEGLAADSPGVLDHALGLALVYGDFGHLERDAGRAAEAIPWFDRALKYLEDVLTQEPRLALARQTRTEFVAGKALALARLGRLPEAAALVGPLAEDKRLADDALYYTACTLARCSAGTGPADGRRRQAEQAVTLLRRAQAEEYFQDPINRKRLEKGADLDALRGRDDFRKLLTDLNGRSKAK